MRLFVALDIPEAVRGALTDVIRELARVCPGARWVRPEGIHVTLKFIGHMEDEKIAEINERLSSIRQKDPIEIAFRQFGFFPNEKHPRVFFVGIESSAGLALLAREIEAKLESLGIPKETRAFQPHLTLARFKTNDGLPELRKKIASLLMEDFGSGSMAEFYLYQSVLQSGGAVYTKLSTHRFVK